MRRHGEVDTDTVAWARHPDRRRAHSFMTSRLMISRSSALDDLRYVIRRLRRSPGFLAVGTLTIALTIGANTAMFSFVNGLLLRPLPYPESNRIVRVVERLSSGGVNGISTLNY